MSQHTEIHPPKWPLKALRFFLKKEYLEEIEGDMEELFHDHVEQRSLNYARRIYAWEMVKLLRPQLLKNFKRPVSINQYPMFKNYFKTSFRSLLKNPLSSFINVFGLSVAIGICLVVFAFMEYDYSIDQFHKNKNTVYLTTFFADRDGTTQQYGLAPRPLAELLKKDFPQIKKVCRIEDRNVVLKYEENVFHERIRYADAEFLEMFTFPLKWGTPSSLTDLSSIILSEDMAIKYFGESNPVGQDMLVIFNDKTKKVFTVAGVAAAFPKSHDIDFNFLINFGNMRANDPTFDLSDWGEFLSATLIQVDKPSDLKGIEQRMDTYKRLQNKAQPDWAISSFAFEPLTTLHEKAGRIKDAIAHDYNVEGRIGMPIIAIFMIVLACFNYINIAIVSAAKRLKEIGVRKVIGANRMKVIVQFLTENIVTTFFALVIGCMLCAFIFLPWFVNFTGWNLELKLLNKNLWIFLGVLLLFTGVASGVYPAFYISRFDAIKIFKGSLQFGRKNPLTKVFLGVQLILACITITAGVVFTQNNSFQNNRSWGYDQKEALYVNVPDQTAFDRMNAAMIQNQNILSVSGSANHLGKNSVATVLRTQQNQHYEVNQFSVDANYFKTMGLHVIEGRGFKDHAESDRQALVVNELFVKNMKLDQPVGHRFEIDSVMYEVIGVLKDFHDRDFFIEVQPTVFTLAAEEDYRYLSLRVKKGAEKETYKMLHAAWATLYPEIPFQGGHQEDVWENYFVSVDRSEQFNKVIASIAVLLASLGLYGLVTLNVSGRIREFSIRKTLGAGVKDIASIIINQYVVLTIIALIIGAPISYLFTKAYLDMLFAYPMPMGVSGTAIALVILIIVLLAVLSTQIRKVVKSNPVEGLKVE
jgi:ABC-type antimicrobial peptide transport system permease subunit